MTPPVGARKMTSIFNTMSAMFDALSERNVPEVSSSASADSNGIVSLREPHYLHNDPVAYVEQYFSQSYDTINVAADEAVLPVASDRRLRCVCVSDTHDMLSRVAIPAGDIFICAGDITRGGDMVEVSKFNEQLAQLPHRYKLVIAGNHDLALDTVRGDKTLLDNCIYLNNSGVELCGYKFFGVPNTGKFGRTMCAFQMRRGAALLEKWNAIPSDTDVLISHGPPAGVGDQNWRGVWAGDVDLTETVVRRLHLRAMVFGHIHEGYGCYRLRARTDTPHELAPICRTLFVNASVCDVRYRPINKPIVFDLPLRGDNADSSQLCQTSD